jgi:hypothetical protein
VGKLGSLVLCPRRAACRVVCLGRDGEETEDNITSQYTDLRNAPHAGPAVVFMLKHLNLSKCPFPSSSIQCHPCPPTRSGGFSPDHGILLCQNRFFSKRHMEDTLTHELVHAFDHCKFDVKWNDLRHHACSEVGHGRDTWLGLRTSTAKPQLNALLLPPSRSVRPTCPETAAGHGRSSEDFIHSPNSIR